MKQETEEQSSQSTHSHPDIIIGNESQGPSLAETSYFKAYILPQILSQQHILPQNRLFQQFLPFDPSIVDVFDQNDICDEPMKSVLILHRSSYILGYKWFQKKDQLIKSQICRIKENYGCIKEGQYIVWVFIDLFQISQRSQIDEDLAILVYNGYTCHVLANGNQPTFAPKIKELSELQMKKGKIDRFQKMHDLESKLIGSKLKISMVLADKKDQGNGRYTFSHLIVVYSFLGFGALLFLQRLNNRKKQHEGEVIISKVEVNSLGKFISHQSCFQKQLTLHTSFQSRFKSKMYFENQKYFHELSIPKQELSKEEQSSETNDIIWLFPILHFFHSSLSIAIGNPSFVCGRNKNERYSFFNNFSEATPLTPIKGANDIIQITDSILRKGYSGTFKKDLQILLFTPEENQILKSFNLIVSQIYVIFPELPRFIK